MCGGEAGIRDKFEHRFSGWMDKLEYDAHLFCHVRSTSLPHPSGIPLRSTARDLHFPTIPRITLKAAPGISLRTMPGCRQYARREPSLLA